MQGESKGQEEPILTAEAVDTRAVTSVIHGITAKGYPLRVMWRLLDAAKMDFDKQICFDKRPAFAGV